MRPAMVCEGEGEGGRRAMLSWSRLSGECTHHRERVGGRGCRDALPGGSELGLARGGWRGEHKGWRDGSGTGTGDADDENGVRVRVAATFEGEWSICLAARCHEQRTSPRAHGEGNRFVGRRIARVQSEHAVRRTDCRGCPSSCRRRRCPSEGVRVQCGPLIQRGDAASDEAQRVWPKAE